LGFDPSVWSVVGHFDPFAATPTTLAIERAIAGTDGSYRFAVAAIWLKSAGGHLCGIKMSAVTASVGGKADRIYST